MLTAPNSPERDHWDLALRRCTGVCRMSITMPAENAPSLLTAFELAGFRRPLDLAPNSFSHPDGSIHMSLELHCPGTSQNPTCLRELVREKVPHVSIAGCIRP